MKLQLLDDNSIWRLYKGDLTKELAKRGIYIGPGVEINNNVRINKGAYINDGVYLGKGVHINENVYIGSGAYICNRVSLNEGVHIGRCVHIDACVSIQANTEIASVRDYVSLSRIGSRCSNLAIYKSRGVIYFSTGCFSGTIEEFAKKVAMKPKDCPNRHDYEAAIVFAKAKFSK